MTIQTHDDGVFAATRPRRPIPAEPQCEWCQDDREVRNALGHMIPYGWCSERTYFDGDAA